MRGRGWSVSLRLGENRWFGVFRAVWGPTPRVGVVFLFASITIYCGYRSFWVDKGAFGAYLCAFWTHSAWDSSGVWARPGDDDGCCVWMPIGVWEPHFSIMRFSVVILRNGGWHSFGWKEVLTRNAMRRISQVDWQIGYRVG